jgi:protein ImuB
LSPSLSRQEQLSPAQPTLDASLILELLRLRLEGSPNPSAITGLRLQALALPADTEQLRLLAEKPKRDLVAANRALARLRAELGDQAVVVAELCSRHLPEAGFRWVPLESLTKASPRFVQKPPLVRRIREQSQPLDTLGRVKDLTGPYRVCGGWWQGEVERDYYFAVTDHREMLWVYYDQRRQRWFLQGQIE